MYERLKKVGKMKSEIERKISLKTLFID